MWRNRIDYELSDLLGEGSQGRVFKGLRRDASSGLTQTVALKVLHSKTAVELWKREFESLSQVRSPYCLQVYGFDWIQGQPALILEYVNGVSLTQLARATFLAEHLVRELVAQIELGLHDLASHGVFHGDLSPHNIMIDRRGQVRLLDFGLANTSLDQIRVTPEFAAPERLLQQPANLASDLYSLGRIEQFLRHQPPDSAVDTPYLHKEPEQRTGRGEASLPELRQELAQKVNAVQTQQHWLRSLKTYSQMLYPPANTRRLSLARALVFALCLTVSGAGAMSRSQPTSALLMVRTQQWLSLAINGQPAGYAPVKIWLPANQKVIIDWAGPNGRGQLTLHLEPGAERTLRDSDFSH